MEMGPRTGRLSAFSQYWVNAVVPLNLSEPVAAGQMYSCGPGKKKRKMLLLALQSTAVSPRMS